MPLGTFVIASYIGMGINAEGRWMKMVVITIYAVSTHFYIYTSTHIWLHAHVPTKHSIVFQYLVPV